jgi:tryptophan 2,3-dioxygenase
MAVARNRREVESGLHRDLAGRLTYAGYLQLDRLLGAQDPLSEPEHHDELLFIVQHQTSELWLKLVIHELEWAMDHLARDDVGPCLKALARVKHIQRQLFEQWGVLATLTPSEYAEFRDVLGPRRASSPCSTGSSSSCWATRTPRCSASSSTRPEQAARLRAALERPSIYDELLRHLARAGIPCPPDSWSATGAARTCAARSCSACSRRSTSSRPSTGRSTSCARSSWTSRSPSSSGASAT